MKNLYCIAGIDDQHTWENFQGGKLWQFITDKANGMEHFAEPAGKLSLVSVYQCVMAWQIVCAPFVNSAEIFALQNFSTYLILRSQVH